VRLTFSAQAKIVAPQNVEISQHVSHFGGEEMRALRCD